MKKDNIISKKLAAYSAAAAAALVVAPVAANAAIVYSGPQNLPVNSSNSYYLDLNNDGGDDFWIGAGPDSSVYFSSRTSGRGFIGNNSSNEDAANLPSGYVIDSSLSAPYGWWTGWEPLNGSGYPTQGSFIGSTGYIGVRFASVTGCTIYGWIHYSGTTGPTGTIIDWAYEDVCDTPILAGGQVASTVPTMGEWGMLILAGLLSAAAIKAINGEKEETA